MADQPFKVRIQVRGYELDPQGHVNQAVYLQYGEHARWELLKAAGFTQDRLISHGVGPVLLKTTIRYQRELRADDEVDVSCAFEWGEGKIFQLVQGFRLPDDTPVAKLEGVVGLLDLETRRLVHDPRGRLKALATSPEVLG